MALRKRPPTQIEYQAVISAGELKLREYVKPAIKKKEVLKTVDEEGQEQVEVISNLSDHLHLSLVDSQNPNEVFFNQTKEKQTKPAFYGDIADNKDLQSNYDQNDWHKTAPGKRVIGSPQPGEEDSKYGQGLAISKSVAAFSEEEPAVKAHNSRMMTTKSYIDMSQVMADRASQEEQSAVQQSSVVHQSEAVMQTQTEELNTLTIQRDFTASGRKIMDPKSELTGEQRDFTASGRNFLDPRQELTGTVDNAATIQIQNQQSFSFP